LAEDVEVVLDGDGDAAEGEREVGGGGFGEGGFEVVGEVGAGGGVALGDAGGEGFQEFGGGGFSGEELTAKGGEGGRHGCGGRWDFEGGSGVGDDFGDAELALGLVGRVGEEGGGSEAVSRGVIAHGAEDGGGVGGGLDAGNVERGEGLDMAEDGIELALECGDLRIGEVEAGEICDVADVDVGLRHGWRLGNGGGGAKFQLREIGQGILKKLRSF